MATKKELKEIDQRIKIREDRLERLKKIHAPYSLIDNETTQLNELKEEKERLTKE